MLKNSFLNSPFGQNFSPNFGNFMNSNDRSQLLSFIQSGKLSQKTLENIKGYARLMGIPESQISQGEAFISQLQKHN